ncbi:MAG: oligosaccharide flippase family protein, partial [Flavobacteriaceae bacterium]|nr:oligosaccharide flippase family protein [Flavobacteriaceae bacterium]
MKFNLSFIKSDFAKNVITLITGTAIAQAIPIAISPILTRIYSPEDFGVFALYLSISSIIAIGATGRYELAINLPAKDEDAIQILWLSCILTLLVSFFTLTVILLFNNNISSLLQNDSIGVWLYFVPLTILFSGIYQSFNYWHNRKKKYAVLSKSRVVQTFNTSAVNLGIGAVAKGGVGGLVFGNLIGVFLSSFYMIYVFFKIDMPKVEIKKKQIKKLAKRYINFPKYDVMASFFNISANQLTNLFFNIFFGAITSG